MPIIHVPVPWDRKPEPGTPLDPAKKDGIVLYMPFNESGGDPRDLSGNGNNGIKTSGVSWIADYLHFAGGANSNIDLFNSSLFEITASNPFSLIVQYRVTTGTERNIIGKNEGALVKWWNLGLNIDSAGAGILTWEADDDATKRTIAGTIATNDGLWRTAIVVRTPGTGYELFIDGKSDGTVADTGDCSNSEKVFIGSQNTRTASNDFLGDIRYATILNKSLNLAEVIEWTVNPWHVHEPILLPVPVAAVGIIPTAHYYRTLLQGDRL